MNIRRNLPLIGLCGLRLAKMAELNAPENIVAHEVSEILKLIPDTRAPIETPIRGV